MVPDFHVATNSRALRRIRSVKNTRQITEAMKMVSAAKLRRAQDNVIAARPYAKMLDAVMSTLISRSDPGALSHPLLTRRPRAVAEHAESPATA